VAWAKVLAEERSHGGGRSAREKRRTTAIEVKFPIALRAKGLVKLLHDGLRIAEPLDDLGWDASPSRRIARKTCSTPMKPVAPTATASALAL
jgi:hypothetical protein